MSDPKSSTVRFAGVDDWHNNPCFKTRLDHAVKRAIDMYTRPFIFSIIVIMTIVGLLFSHFASEDDLFRSIFTITSGFSAAFVATIGTIYWNLDSIYGRKWSLMFEQWYRINMLTKADARSFHFCNLYMDVITMKLSRCFRKHVANS